MGFDGEEIALRSVPNPGTVGRMALFEIKIEISPSDAEVADHTLLEHGLENWSVLEDVMVKKAWLVGVFTEEAVATAEWAAVGTLLVEAGVIRGSNYATLVSLIRDHCGVAPVKTLAMYENVGSRFKSDFVGEYYDDATHDLTFWWEVPNNHWKTL